MVQGLSLPLLIRWLKMKPQDNTDEEEKELQLYLANSTLHFIEQDFPVPLDNKSEQQLKMKYEVLINELTKEINRHKKAKRNDSELIVKQQGVLLSAQLEISKFQRALLIKLHKEGEFSDAVIRQVEQEMDINELKLNLQVSKDE